MTAGDRVQEMGLWVQVAIGAFTAVAAVVAGWAARDAKRHAARSQAAAQEANDLTREANELTRLQHAAHFEFVKAEDEPAGAYCIYARNTGPGPAHHVSFTMDADPGHLYGEAYLGDLSRPVGDQRVAAGQTICFTTPIGGLAAERLGLARGQGRLTWTTVDGRTTEQPIYVGVP